MTMSTAGRLGRPPVTSSVLAVGVAIGVLALLAGSFVQRQLLAMATVGIVLFGLGARRYQQDRDGISIGLRLGGGLIVAAAIWYISTVPAQFTHRLELLPGVIGLWLFVGALSVQRTRWRRQLIDLGVGVIFLSILVSGVLRGSSELVLVISAAGLIVARDLAENAVSLGTQIGTGESTMTRPAELRHLGYSAVVAGGAVVAVLGVSRLGIEGVPFVGLVALLVASVALVLVGYE